jgi:hypothetical protein
MIYRTSMNYAKKIVQNVLVNEHNSKSILAEDPCNDE